MVKAEKFFAWLDGALPPEEAARVEAEVAANAHLSQLADEHRGLATDLRQAFGEVETQPVPERLLGAFDRSDKIVSLADAQAVRSARTAPSIWVQMGALAATLAIGIVAGNMIADMPIGRSSSPIATESGQLVASAELANALQARLASMPADSGPRIGLTFRDKSGAICRTFEDQLAIGMACRDGGEWRIRSLFQAPVGQATDYRMASEQDPELMEAVQASIEGEPFDAVQEEAAMRKGWR